MSGRLRNNRLRIHLPQGDESFVSEAVDKRCGIARVCTCLGLPSRLLVHRSWERRTDEQPAYGLETGSASAVAP